MSELDKLFAQLTRDAIGIHSQFDRIAQINTSTYPPHNIVKLNDSHFVIELACAGFSPDEITIESQNNTLTIIGKKDYSDPKEYVHRGLAFRDFTKQLMLGEYIEVTKADFSNGLLIIDLMKSIPEEKKPKKIPIGNSKPVLLNEVK